MVKKQQVTLNDIAKKLKVSKVTVSKAMRDHPDIGIETKNKVREIARDMGYVPNRAARNLSANHSKTIGLVVPKIAHHFFAKAIEIIYDEAFKRGYEILLMDSQENPEYENTHIRTLLSMGVDALIVSITQNTGDFKIFNLAKDRGVPLLFFDRVVDEIGFATITTDDENGAYDLTGFCLEKGQNSIGHIGGYRNINIGRDRYHGYKRALEEANIDINKNWIIEGGYSKKDGYRGLKEMYSRGALPETIFAVTYPVALGIYTAAFDLRLKIPDDIRVICFGGTDENEFMMPSLTYLDQPIAEIGRKSVELILKEISNPGHNRPVKLVIPGKIKTMNAVL